MVFIKVCPFEIHKRKVELCCKSRCTPLPLLDDVIESKRNTRKAQATGAHSELPDVSKESHHLILHRSVSLGYNHGDWLHAPTLKPSKRNTNDYQQGDV